MPVKKEPSGARSVEAEVEVPGSPEDVWKAIATGPGISAWFVPTTCDEEAGGQTTSNFGPGMDSVATITEWAPPNKFAAETEEEPGRVATEWHVEARSGGTCVVRVVHRWFTDSDEWDDQFDGHTHGWKSFFRILRVYLTHFRGEPSTIFALSPFRVSTPEEIWQAVTSSLGVAPNDDSLITPSGPATIEHLGVDARSELILRLEGTVPGTIHMFPMAFGEQTLFSVRAYLYGTEAPGAAPEIEAQWSRWIQATLPGETPTAPPAG